MTLTNTFSRQPCAVIFIEMVTASFGIGVMDVITGYQIRLLPLYVIPIFVVAWCCNRKLAILAGLIAGGLSLAADWITNDPDLSGWIQIWEIPRHLGTCLAVGLVGSALRAKQDLAAARIALLERSQRLERELISISDSERRRVGQDLHDGICQHLAAVGCSATALRDDLEKLSLRSEADAAGELANLLQDAVVQTRDLARELVPVRLDQIGLVLALESLAQSVSRLHGLNCTFEVQGATRRYQGGTALNLYRIAQEAINNATKHGKANNIAVSLHTTEQLTTLRVSDDGVGIPAAGANGSGMGLNIMAYRARLNGGELHIEQPASGGTVIWCTVKTNNEANEIPLM